MPRELVGAGGRARGAAGALSLSLPASERGSCRTSRPVAEAACRHHTDHQGRSSRGGPVEPALGVGRLSPWPPLGERPRPHPHPRESALPLRVLIWRPSRPQPPQRPCPGILAVFGLRGLIPVVSVQPLPLLPLSILFPPSHTPLFSPVVVLASHSQLR